MEITSQSKQEFTVMLKLSEVEARALHDIVAYGYKPFIEVFKDKLGSSYIKMHEQGAQSLFETVQHVMPSHFSRMDRAREVFSKSTSNVEEPQRDIVKKRQKCVKYVLALILDKIGLTFKNS